MGFSNERMRTGQLVNWFLLDGLELTPAGNPVTKALPLPFGVDHLIGFNELLTCKHPENAGVHFFLDDYQFERFWRQPQRYLDALAKFPLVLGPTFSMYLDFPEPMQRWNHYRNQFLVAWLQSKGVCAIQTPDGQHRIATVGALTVSARAVPWRSVRSAPVFTTPQKTLSGKALPPCWTPASRRRFCSMARYRRTPQRCSGSGAFSGRHSRTGWQSGSGKRNTKQVQQRRVANGRYRRELQRLSGRKKHKSS